MAQLRRPFYQSQATAGIAFNWTGTDPTHPDLAFPISATCPSPLPAGITSCGTDSSGNTVYQFAFNATPGVYPKFMITTFDAAPAGTSPFASTFGTNAHELAQAFLPTPLTIVAGQDNPIPSMTFYGIPASVSLLPYPSQSHVVTNGAHAYEIIGNTQQLFGVAALDADGFLIGATASGAPTISVTESTSDAPAEFSIAPMSGPNEFGITAISAPASGGGSITVSATAGVSGPTPASTTYAITPVQEMWLTLSSGGVATAYGFAGYPLYPPSYAPQTTPLDFTYDNSTLNACGTGVACLWEAATALPDGSFIAYSQSDGHLYRFLQGTGSLSPAFPSELSGYISPSVASIAADNAGHIFIADSNLYVLSSYTASSVVSPSVAPTKAQAVAVAPTLAALPSALQQTVWVSNGAAGQSSILSYAVNASGALTNIPVTINDSVPIGNPTVLGFDSSGNLWAFDGAYLHVYALSGSASGATLTELLSTPIQPASGLRGASFGATSQGTMWLASFGSYPWMAPLALSGCPGSSCTVLQNPIAYLSAAADASIVVP